MSRKHKVSEYYVGPNGERYVRVSAILEASGTMRARPRNSVPVHDQRYHAFVGNLVHRSIRYLIAGETLPGKIPPLARRVMGQFTEWRNHYLPSVLAEPETTFYSKLGYAGSPDIACALAETRFVIDVKTSPNIRKYDLAQIEAYGHLLDENYPGQPFRRAILQLFPDCFVFHQFEKDEARFSLFMKMLVTWKEKHQSILETQPMQTQ